MAQIGTVQICGNANSTKAEVELNTLAARFVERPNDFALWGSYRVSSSVLWANQSSNGLISAIGLAALINLDQVAPATVSGRAGTRTTLAALRRVFVCNIMDAAGTSAAGEMDIHLIRNLAPVFTSNSTIVDLIKIPSKMRSTMPEANCMVLFAPDGSGASNTSGFNQATNITQEARDMAVLVGGIPQSGGGFGPQGNFPLFDSDVSRFPLLLDKGQSVMVQLNSGASWTTSTDIRMQITFDWNEYRLGEY